MTEPRSRIANVHVFVNYRTEDEPFGAALVDHELSARFGSAKIFRASKSIRLGEDFTEVILAAVRRSAALLVLIGPRWLAATDSTGVRRIDQPEDWVRQEIAEAFRHDVRVIPILLNADLPRPEDLPEDIAQLARCQYLRIHHRNSRHDVRRLIDELAELVPQLTPRRRGLIRVAVVLLAVMIVAGGLVASYYVAGLGAASRSDQTPTTQTDTSGALLRRDRLTLNAEDGASLDDAMTGTGISVRDLYFPQAPQSDLVIAPEGDAAMAAVSDEPGFADCAAALRARRDDYVQVKKGAWLCALTNQGNVAAIHILDVATVPQRMTLSVTVWHR